MPDTVIQAEGLSKKYILRHEPGRHLAAFRDVLANQLASLYRRKSGPDTNHEEFWALRDVSFEIKQGEAVGIIGRNGAGKSTLLKILSKITEPTEGRITLNGRIASLLEVGTGFHPELTGRENIYLNGAILGMSRAEIRKKFDEIVAFAEVEKFLDTPVKHYSSGMYVRLAFAVAAHLEPEILIIDEVLAVGDVQFQKKCLGKMQDVSSQEGRTVLFVSHNLGAIQTLCSKAIHLKAGRLMGVGPATGQIAEYLKDTQPGEEGGLRGPVKINSVVTLTKFSFSPNPASSDKPVEFLLEFEVKEETRLNEITILIYSNLGVRIAVLDLRPHGITNLQVKGPKLVLGGIIRSLPLVEGDYHMGLSIHMDTEAQNFLDLTHLHVIPPINQGHVPYPAVHRGLVELDFSLTIKDYSVRSDAANRGTL